jgi:hypothetical protein
VNSASLVEAAPGRLGMLWARTLAAPVGASGRCSVISPQPRSVCRSGRDMAHPLFDSTPADRALDEQRRKMAEAVAALPAEAIPTDGIDDLVAELVAFYRIEPLVLRWDAVTAAYRDVEIDGGGEGKCEISDHARPSKVTGTEVTEFVPFSGAPGLFGWAALDGRRESPARIHR